MRQTREKLIEKLKNLNPHWESGAIDPLIRACPRRAYFRGFFELVAQFDVQRAVILMGPRRVGKTVMLWHAIQALIDQGVPPPSIVYIPIDVLGAYEPMSLDSMVDLYLEAVGVTSLEGCYLFFDEIQYQGQWAPQIKTMVDFNRRTKCIVSGSAAGVISKGIQESGAGRFTDYALPPLLFYEYLIFVERVDELLSIEGDNKKSIRVKDIEALNHEFINYLNYGGFPEPIFNKHVREDPKRYVREDIIDRVLLKDLPSTYGIANVLELDSFFRRLIYQTGNEVTFENLSQVTGLNRATIEKYIHYLADSFLIRVLPRVDDDGKTFKRRNFFKVYLTNPSMYAAMWGLLSLEDKEDLGHIVETALISQWEHDRRWLDHVYYARFKGGEGEVDMVIKDMVGDIKACIEIKWSDRYFNHPSQLKSLARFVEKHHPSEVVATSVCQEGVRSLADGSEVTFIPAAVFCFMIGYHLIHNNVDGPVGIMRHY